MSVSWTGNIDGAANDWIAAYSPVPESHDAFLQVMPVKYMSVTQSGQGEREREREACASIRSKMSREQRESHTHRSLFHASHVCLCRNLTGTPGVSGSISMWLLHMRAPWVFAYMRGGYETPTVLAVSNRVTYVPEQANAPMQIHLARTVDPTQMRIIWVTTNASKPVVKFMPTSRRRRHSRGLTGAVTVAANTTTYTREQMCGGMAAGLGWRDPGAIHNAVLNGLVAGEQYTYMVGDAASSIFSAENTFSAAPQPGADTDIIIFGDQGQAEFDGSIGWAEWVNVGGVTMEDADQPAAINTSIAVANDVKDGTVSPTAIAFIIGDVSYARGREAFWDQHAYLNQPFASRLPVMTCLGNHEIGWNYTYFPGGDSGGECGVAVQARFPMPSPPSKEAERGGPGFSDTPWYSFDHGSVHFLLMSTEHDFTAGSEQRAFIESDLAAVDRTRTPWVLMAGHRPFYVSSSDATSPRSDMVVAAMLRAQLEPLLLKYRVDAYFAGHHHDAQRTCAVFNQTCADREPRRSQLRGNDAVRDMDMDRDVEADAAADELDSDADASARPSFGTVHILTGAAGQWCNVGLNPTAFDWLEFANTQVHGYSRVKARGNELTIEFVASSDRTVIDSVTLIKTQQGRAPLLRKNLSASYKLSDAVHPLLADE